VPLMFKQNGKLHTPFRYTIIYYFRKDYVYQGVNKYALLSFTANYLYSVNWLTAGLF
jgi:hypothetical protein